MSGADGHAVHQQPGPGLGEGPVQEVDRAGRRSAGGDHDVGGGVPQRVPEQPEVVPDGPHFGHLGTGRPQPGRQQRPERVPDQARTWDARGEQLIAEDEQFDHRATAHGEPVVTAGGGQAEHGRADQGATGQQRLAAAALLAARADVLTGGQRLVAAVVQQRAVRAAVLTAQDGGGAGRQLGAGGDLDGGAVGQRRGRGPAGQHPPGDPPGARPGDRPAVHRGGVEGGQVGQRGERLGEGAAERLGERQPDRRQRTQPGPAGGLAGLRPAQHAGTGRRGGHGGLADGAHGSPGPAAALQRSASAAVRRAASATASGPPPCWAAA